MWSRLADELFDHPKVTEAADQLGPHTHCLVIGFYSMALMWSNRHLTDGVLSNAVVKSFSRYVINPTSIADALVHAGLFDKHESGYRIHDFRDYNPSALDIKRKRRADRERKAAERGGNGRA